MQIRRKKIIATLGPATDEPETLRALLEAGADVLRINLSHGTHKEQALRAAQVRPRDFDLLSQEVNELQARSEQLRQDRDAIQRQQLRCTSCRLEPGSRSSGQRMGGC